MTLPASGAISLGNVRSEVGASGSMSLGWVRDNTYYAYKNLNSLHGKTWFQAVSATGSVSRVESGTTTNCGNNCASQQNYSNWPTNLANCNLIANSNCNQCGYTHGTYIQANCNCNCNCWVCNCNYTACNCICDCACESCGG